MAEKEIIGKAALGKANLVGKQLEEAMGGIGAVLNHSLLNNRSDPNAHPMSSITGLTDILQAKLGFDSLVAGSNITITREADTLRIACTGGGSDIAVEDILTSTSTENALSANQGRVLNEKITTLNEKIEEYDRLIILLEEILVKINSGSGECDCEDILRRLIDINSGTGGGG